MTIPFSKPPTTHAQQVQLLQRRGMIVNDPLQAEHYLKMINYYRLCAYWLPFELNHTTHQFKQNTSFDVVLNHYIFDRELRLLIFDAIERFEVSLRSRWAYCMAHHHGPHTHLDHKIVKNSGLWIKNLSYLHTEIKRSSGEVFIKHFYAKYNDPLPPIWAVSEIISLGSLSKWYGNLAPKRTRRDIADTYNLDDDVLQSWLQHFTYVRNLCAHHSRVWNRQLTIIPKLPKTKPSGLRTQCQNGSRNIYNTLVFLLHCMDIIAPNHRWRQRLQALIARHNISVMEMGFPTNWNTFPIWR